MNAHTTHECLFDGRKECGGGIWCNRNEAGKVASIDQSISDLRGNHFQSEKSWDQ